MNFIQGYYFMVVLLSTIYLPIISKPIPRKTLSLGNTERKFIIIELQRYPPAAFALLSIGDPPINEQLHIDTGSELLWVVHKNESDYDPLKSSSFSYIRCSGLPNSPILRTDYKTGQCKYNIPLADNARYVGTLGSETVSFKTGDRGLGALNNVLFGFGLTKGGEQVGSGTLGLQLGELSIVKSIGSKFSICIGNFYDNFHEEHFLALDDDAIFVGEEISLNTEQQTYKINLNSITVNGESSLDIQKALSKSNTLLDTGTSSIDLVKEVYDVVAGKIIRTMVNAGYRRYGKGKTVCFRGMVPKNKGALRVSLTFDQVTIDMMAATLFIQINANYFCLNVDESLMSKTNVIGIPVLQDHNFGFDILNNRIHIKKIECRKLYDNYKDELGHRYP